MDAVFANAAIGPGAAVLEIGCGTGQLTRKLAGRALNLTAIDIGVAMVAAAQGNIADPAARLQVASFEDLADAGPFDLIVSATAFHWVDPGIGLAKAARLLRPAGWLALLATCCSCRRSACHRTAKGVFFLDPRHGWVVWAGLEISGTASGGRSWSMAPLGRPSWLFTRAEPAYVDFTDPRHHWVAADVTQTALSPAGVLFGTTDGPAP